MSSVALKKAMPTIEYADDRIIVSTPEPFLDLMDVDREYVMGSIPARIIKDLGRRGRAKAGALCGATEGGVLLVDASASG